MKVMQNLRGLMYEVGQVLLRFPGQPLVSFVGKRTKSHPSCPQYLCDAYDGHPGRMQMWPPMVAASTSVGWPLMLSRRSPMMVLPCYASLQHASNSKRPTNNSKAATTQQGRPKGPTVCARVCVCVCVRDPLTLMSDV